MVQEVKCVFKHWDEDVGLLVGMGVALHIGDESINSDGSMVTHESRFCESWNCIPTRYVNISFNPVVRTVYIGQRAFNFCILSVFKLL